MSQYIHQKNYAERNPERVRNIRRLANERARVKRKLQASGDFSSEQITQYINDLKKEHRAWIGDKYGPLERKPTTQFKLINGKIIREGPAAAQAAELLVPHAASGTPEESCPAATQEVLSLSDTVQSQPDSEATLSESS